MGPHFLSLAEVLAIHLDQVEHYGGDPGVRDLALLQSAVAQPSASFGGELLHADLLAMASAYLYHIVQNHPFVDGNKRTGTAAAIVFLELNGLELDAPWEDLADLVIAVADGRATKQEIEVFLRRYTRPSNL